LQLKDFTAEPLSKVTNGGTKKSAFMFSKIYHPMYHHLLEKDVFSPTCNVSSKSRATNENFSIQAKRFKGNLPFVRKHLSK
jgi:hypothetical protein